VSAEVIVDATGPDAQRAAARSRAYQLFTEAFRYPQGDLLAAIASGDLAEALHKALSALDPGLATGVDTAALADTGQDDDLAVEYTRLFDVGVSGPPCPLYGGLYGGARMKTMEEAVRFYNHFGLTLSDDPRELPDHITTELEFLHYLAFKEAEALGGGEDPGAFRRAQRDFLERHPGRFVPKLRERLEQQSPMRFFLELTRQLERLLAHELESLIAEVGAAPPASSQRR
ncbi:MAG: molecular chaperone TorD family protein, partial [Deltaproteobacteria bacterium]